VPSAGIFAKTWWRETIKKTVAKRYQFMENFRLLFGLLTPCRTQQKLEFQLALWASKSQKLLARANFPLAPV